MFKQLAAAALAWFAIAASAASVDVNKATQADLDGIKGIGPAKAAAILEARKSAPFKDWQDLIGRVKGIGEGNAAKYSAEGLTVNGAAFKADAAATTKPATTKPADTKAGKP
ncbi:MAG: helix-hairpin-helix domain-containing protein [Burkholderiales bacterium]|nr:helix-hairpin-helix domain-containing protein [Burkholderiales bacterium]